MEREMDDRPCRRVRTKSAPDRQNGSALRAQLQPPGPMIAECGVRAFPAAEARQNCADHVRKRPPARRPDVSDRRRLLARHDEPACEGGETTMRTRRAPLRGCPTGDPAHP